MTTKHKPATPLQVRGPYQVGDKVKIKGTRLYGEVAGFNHGILVRLRSGRMEQLAKERLEWNYGRS